MEKVVELGRERGESGECGGEVFRRLEGLIGRKVVVMDTIIGNLEDWPWSSKVELSQRK